MAHGITEVDRLLFNVRNDKPWHGMGQSFEGLATRQNVEETCPFFRQEVIKVPCTYKEHVSDRHFFTAYDGAATPLAVVGDEYQVVQNSSLLDFVDTLLCDKRGATYETAGSLWSGRKVWLLVKLPEYMEFKGRDGTDDIVEQYLLLSNAHDGSQHVKIGATPIRVVCQNTLNLSYSSFRKNSSTWFMHSGDVNAKLARIPELLNITVKQFAETKELYNSLVKTEPSEDDIQKVLDVLFPATKTSRSEKQQARVKHLAEYGVGNEAFAGTAWALYNGITELVDWYSLSGSKDADKESIRANSVAFVGSGVTLKERALETIASICLT